MVELSAVARGVWMENVQRRCPKCGLKVAAEYMRHHWAAVHSSFPKKPSKVQVPRPDQVGPDWATCRICGCVVKSANLRKHIKKQHPTTIASESQRRTEKTKQKERALPEYREPIDFLDLPNVVSGGGFGVGKGKKR